VHSETRTVHTSNGSGSLHGAHAHRADTLTSITMVVNLKMSVTSQHDWLAANTSGSIGSNARCWSWHYPLSTGVSALHSGTSSIRQPCQHLNTDVQLPLHKSEHKGAMKADDVDSWCAIGERLHEEPTAVRGSTIIICHSHVSAQQLYTMDTRRDYATWLSSYGRANNR
jgi:hypothetical protein